MSFIFFLSIIFLSFFGSSSANSEFNLSQKLKQETMISLPGYEVLKDLSGKSEINKKVSEIC